MKSDFNNYTDFMRKCTVVVLTSLFLLAPVVGGYVFLLRRVGEFVYAGELARMSYGKQKILWLSGYYDPAGYVKPAVASYFKPKVAIFGSSRVMQIRSLMFRRLPRREFYNLGGAIASFADATVALKTLESNQAKPELIILGVDWRWLQRKTSVDVKEKETRFSSMMSSFRPNERTQENLDFLLDQIALFKNPWKDPALYSEVLNGNRKERVSGRYMIGMGARKGAGFRNDGSERHWRTINHPPPLRERRARAYAGFREGAYHGNEISETQLADFEQFLALCQTYDINVITILPPLDPAIVEFFGSRSAAAGFWNKLPTALRRISRKHNFQFRDYTRRHPLTTDPWEYLDWFHGSDVVFGKLILDLANTRGTSELLSEYVDADQLERDLRNAVSPLDLYGD